MATSAFTPAKSDDRVSLETVVRTSEAPQLHIVARLREIVASRQILGNLVRKDVKVKYKSSVLGAAWSMLNPLLFLLVFTLVFKVILRNPIPNFAVYLLAGLLAWNLYSTALTLAARSIVDNSNLVTKVYFPREILPLASIGTAGVDFVLQAIVLALFIAALRQPMLGLNLALLPLALLALFAFTTAIAFWVAALNVRYRDVQHLLNIALMLWFWVTPIVYQSGLVYKHFAHRQLLFDLYLANPMSSIVAGFQRSLYAIVYPPGAPHTAANAVLLPVSIGWMAMLLAAVSAGSLALLWLAWRTFFRLSGDFAEEL